MLLTCEKVLLPVSSSKPSLCLDDNLIGKLKVCGVGALFGSTFHFTDFCDRLAVYVVS